MQRGNFQSQERLVRHSPVGTIAGHQKGKTQGRIAHGIFLLCALVSILTTIGIVFSLVAESIGFFRQVSPWDFLTGIRWSPILKPSSFGVLPLVAGTILVAAVALAVAVPTGMAIAIYLSEYAPNKVRRALKPILEVLAGIPTVVYGYFALTFVTPLLRWFFPDLLVFNALSAGVVMGLMIIPICLLYTSPSPRDLSTSRMPSSA